VFSSYDALPTEVPVGGESGLRHLSALHCDNILSLSRATLRDYVGSLPTHKLAEVNQALTVALALDEPL
jgi:mRNA interferase MazF